MKAILLLLSATALAATAEPDLPCRYEKGDVQRYALTWTTTRRWSSKAAPPGSARQAVRVEWRQEVAEVSEDGSATLSRTFESLLIEVRSALMTATVDSRMPDAKHAGKHELLYRMVREVVGKKVTVTMDRRGRIRSRSGATEILDGLRTTFGGETWAPLYLGIMEGVLSPDLGSHPLLDHWCARGAETWRDTVPVGTADLEFRSTRKARADVRHLGRKCARFAVEGEVHARPGDASLKVTKSSTKGEVLYDRESGLVERATASVRLTLTRPPGPVTEKVEMEITLERRDAD